MVWNATGIPILNDVDSVTGYDGGWVYVNPDDDPDVQPAGRPNYRPPKGKEWNDGKATSITNKERVLTAYTGAWVDADTEDVSSTVQPANRIVNREYRRNSCDSGSRIRALVSSTYKNAVTEPLRRFETTNGRRS